MRNRCPRFPMPVSSHPQTANRKSRTLTTKWLLFAASCFLAAGWLGCASSSPHPMEVTRKPFGQVDGKEVYLFSLRNTKGAEALISSYGGIVTSLKVPDSSGHMGDVVLGLDNLA